MLTKTGEFWKWAGACAPTHSGRRLLDVTRFGHFADSELLAVGQSFFNCLLTGQRSCDLLTDVVADTLEFRDRDELDARVRNWVLGRVCRVNREDRVLDGLGERCRFQQARVFVDRLTCTAWHSNPALRLANHLEVLLRRRPLQEVLCDILVLRACRQSQRP